MKNFVKFLGVGGSDVYVAPEKVTHIVGATAHARGSCRSNIHFDNVSVAVCEESETVVKRLSSKEGTD